MRILIILICIFNVVMWLLFLRHFKNLFSTDGIINSTKEEINKILVDLNRQTERNLTVLEGTMNRLKALNAEVEKKIRLANDLELRKAETAQVASKLKGKSAVRRTAISAYEKNKPSKSKISEEDTVVLTRSGEQLSVEPMQTTLFNEKSELEASGKAVSGVNEFHVDDKGASYSSVPLITPEVFVPETPVVLSRQPETLNSNIIKLFDQGYTIETIASELGCTVSEVQLILDLEGKL